MDDRKHDREFVVIMAIVLCAIGAAAWLFFGQVSDVDASAAHSKTVTVTIDGASYACKPAPHKTSVE